MAKGTKRIPTKVMRSMYPKLGSAPGTRPYPDVVSRLDEQFRGDLKYRNKSMKRY